MVHTKMLVEGGGAVGLAVLPTNQITPADNRKTCIVFWMATLTSASSQTSFVEMKPMKAVD